MFSPFFLGDIIFSTMKETKNKEFIYEKIADNIAAQINQGTFKEGEKVPSVRKLSKDLGVSASTIEQSYILLESQGLIEAKPQSGYYVRDIFPEPEIANNELALNDFENEDLIVDLLEATKIPNIICLGSCVFNPEIMPGKKLNKIMASICRDSEPQGISYEFPPGNFDLRRQIAKRSIEWGRNFSPEDIIITSGATEGLFICLKAVAKRGDAIITESPTSYMMQQAIKELEMKTLEIPTHPKHGIDIDFVESAIKSHKVGACILSPNVSTPLCSTMSLDDKKKLYNILVENNVPLIEDDVHGELYFGETKPTPIKAIDDKGIVLYTSSFSKTIAPGYRVGWIYPGRYYEEVKSVKFLHSVATNSLAQMAFAEFLRAGGYDRYLRNLRKYYKTQVQKFSKLINEHFPAGTRMSRPCGGFYLWIKLPNNIDSIKYHKEALKESIYVAPGPLFTSTKNFDDYIRISCAGPWTDKQIEESVKTLGNLCRKFTNQ